MQRERLLRAQLDVEDGRMTDAEFKVIEGEVFGRLREIKAARGEGPMGMAAGNWSVENVEADVGAQNVAVAPAQAPARPARKKRR